MDQYTVILVCLNLFQTLGKRRENSEPCLLIREVGQDGLSERRNQSMGKLYKISHIKKKTTKGNFRSFRETGNKEKEITIGVSPYGS
jgi:hypothetical protein